MAQQVDGVGVAQEGQEGFNAVEGPAGDGVVLEAGSETGAEEGPGAEDSVEVVAAVDVAVDVVVLEDHSFFMTFFFIFLTDTVKIQVIELHLQPTGSWLKPFHLVYSSTGSLCAFFLTDSCLCSKD